MKKKRPEGAYVSSASYMRCKITQFLPQLTLGLLIAWEIVLVMWKLRNKGEFRN
jgi:hypothetical protein